MKLLLNLVTHNNLTGSLLNNSLIDKKNVT